MMMFYVSILNLLPSGHSILLVCFGVLLVSTIQLAYRCLNGNVCVFDIIGVIINIIIPVFAFIVSYTLRIPNVLIVVIMTLCIYYIDPIKKAVVQMVSVGTQTSGPPIPSSVTHLLPTYTCERITTVTLRSESLTVTATQINTSLVQSGVIIES